MGYYWYEQSGLTVHLPPNEGTFIFVHRSLVPPIRKQKDFNFFDIFLMENAQAWL